MNQFVDHSRKNSVVRVNKDDKNELEKSHWDHSRSWSQNFRTEQLTRFTEKKDPASYTKNKYFGYQNTLN